MTTARTEPVYGWGERPTHVTRTTPAEAVTPQVSGDWDAEAGASGDAGSNEPTTRENPGKDEREGVGMTRWAENADRALAGGFRANMGEADEAAIAAAERVYAGASWQEHERWRANGPPLDPTPEAQRAGFEAVVAEGRPTTVEVKSALERLEQIVRLLLGITRSADWTGTAAFDLRAMAGIMDRLGCALIAQDAELAEANKALEFVASRAIPLDDAGLAELIQEARVSVDCIHGGAFGQMRRERTADTIARLVEAVLDQARKAQAMEVDRDAARDVLDDMRRDEKTYGAADRDRAVEAVLSRQPFIGGSSIRDFVADQVDAAFQSLGLTRTRT